MLTYDVNTIDSTGAFLVGELERLDQKLHEPLVAVTWGRDMDLREDVSMADEHSSYTNNTFGAPGGINSTGKNFVGKDTNMIPGISVDIGKTVSPLYLWALEIGFTIPELLASQQVGRPIDEAKFNGMQLKWNMDIDEMIYIGDSGLSKYGLLNSSEVTAANVALGAASSRLWSTKTHDEILADFNALLSANWAQAGYALCPNKVLLPPAKFSSITMRKVSDAGNVSILKYVQENCIANSINGKPLDIQPCKWLVNRGTGGTVDRMISYTQDKDRVRFPLVPMQRTPLEYRSIYHLTTYFGRLGVLEIVYPHSIYYADGI